MTYCDIIYVMNLTKVAYRCGCVTEDFGNGVKIDPCVNHAENGYVWVALQHPKKLKEPSVKLSVIFGSCEKSVKITEHM